VVQAADRTISLNPAKSLLKYQVGDEIKLNEGAFLLLLSTAFFAEMASKFVSAAEEHSQ